MALRQGGAAGRILGGGSLDGMQRSDARMVPAQLERLTRHYHRYPNRIGTPAPILYSCSPAFGSQAGGYPVTITGDYFDLDSGCGVSPQGVSAPTGVHVVDETTVTTTAWGASAGFGQTDIYVYSNYNIGIALLATSTPRAFRYQPWEQENAALFFRAPRYSVVAGVGTWLSSERGGPSTDYYPASASSTPPAQSADYAPTFTAASSALVVPDLMADWLGTGDCHTVVVIDLASVGATTGNRGGDAIWTDALGSAGLCVYNASGTYYVEFWAMVGGVAKRARTALGASSGRFVVQGKKSGGNLQIRLNGGAWVVGDACGTTDTGGDLWMGTSFTGAKFRGTIWALATYTAAQADSTFADLINAWAGVWFPAALTKLLDLDSRHVTLNGVDPTKVDSWQDQSGNGWDATCAAGSEATYVGAVAEFGGVAGVSFPAADTKLYDTVDTIAASIGTDPCTMFLVAQQTVNTATGNSYFVMSKPGSSPMGILCQGLTAWTPYEGGYPPPCAQTNPEAPSMLAAVFTGGDTARFYANSKISKRTTTYHGEDDGIAVPSVPATVGLQQAGYGAGGLATGFRIGNWQTSDPAYSASGVILRMVVYKGALSQSQIETVLAGFETLYGILVEDAPSNALAASFKVEAGNYTDSKTNYAGTVESSWRGKTSRGYTIERAAGFTSATARPSVTTINSLNAPLTDGVSEYMFAGNVNDAFLVRPTVDDLFAGGGGAGTFLVAIKPLTAAVFVPGTIYAQHPYDNPAVFSDTSGYVGLHFTDAGFTAGLYDATPRDSGGGAGTNDGWQMATVAATNNATHIAAMRWDGTNLEVACDAVAGVITWVSVACGAINYRLGNIRFGTNYTGSLFVNANWGAVRMYRKKLSNLEINAEAVEMQTLLGWSQGFVSASTQNLTSVGGVGSSESVPSPFLTLSISFAGNISSAEAFGTNKLNLNVSTPTSITSSEVVPSPKLNENISAAGNISSAEAFGTNKINENVGPAGNIASSEAVPSPQINENVGPAGNIASAEVFGTNKLNLNISAPISVTSAEIVPSPSLVPVIAPSSIASSEVVPSPQLNLNVSAPTSITSAEVVPSPNINENVGPAGNVASAEVVPSPAVSPGAATVTQTTGIASSEVVPSPKVNENVGPAGNVTSAEIVPSPKLNENVGPAGNITSSEAVSSPQLNLNVSAPTSITSSEVVPSPVVSPGATSLTSVGNVPSAEVVSSPQLNLNLSPTSISSSESVPNPTVSPGAVSISSAGNVTSGEAVPSPKLNENVQNAGNVVSAEVVSLPQLNLNISSPTSVTSGEVVPSPSLARVVAPSSITSSESVPSPAVSPGATTLSGVGNIPSAENVDNSTIVEVGNAIIPFSIISAENVPSPQLSLNLTGVGGVASGAVVPSPQVNFTLTPSSVASAEVIGAPSLALNVASAGNVATSESVSNPQVNQSLTAGGVLSAEAVPSPRLNENVAGAGNIASSEVVPLSSVSNGLQISGVGNVPTAEVIGAHAVLPVSIISPNSVMSSEVVPSPQINESLLNVGDVPSSEVFGPPTVVGTSIVSPSSITSAEDVSSPALNMNVLDAGDVSSAEAVSAPTVQPGSVTISPASIASGEAVDSPALTVISFITDAGDILSGEAFGLPALTLFITAGDIASGEIVPSPSVVLVLQYITGAGDIASAERVGAPLVLVMGFLPLTVLRVEGPAGAVRPSSALRFIPPMAARHAQPALPGAPTTPSLPSGGFSGAARPPGAPRNPVPHTPAPPVTPPLPAGRSRGKKPPAGR